MKFTVTSELSTLLRTLRIQNGISSKELASHIDKSPSYVSKLESEDIKNITKEDLMKVLTFIAGGGDFYAEVLPTVVKALEAFIQPDRLIEQVWLVQYDVIDRPVDLPDAMAEDIRTRMEELKITAGELADLLNQNMDSELTSMFPANEAMAMRHEHGIRLLIRVEVCPDVITGFITKKNLHTTYIMVHNIAWMLIRRKKYGNINKKLISADAEELLRDTCAYLEQYAVHSLIRFSHLLSSDEFIGRQRLIASTFDSVSAELISKIVDFFQEAMKYDSLGTTQTLHNLTMNLGWDPAFILRVMGYPFYKMENLSYLQKKNLLGEMDSLLDKYDKIPEFEKKFEIY